MVWIEDTLFCDGCGVEIQLAPVIYQEKSYCCQDCADGIKCDCGERMEMDERRGTGSDQAQMPGISWS